MKNYSWLPHLQNKMLRNVRNDKFCSYLIALEGWRRGLDLSFSSEKVTKNGLHSPGLQYKLSSGENTHTFYKARGDKVKGQAFSVGSNKFASKKWLEKQGIPVAKGEKFTKDVSNEEIVEYVKKIGFPVVLKPVVGAQGKGVVANIKNEKYLTKALIYVRNELKYTNVILEQHIAGKEYRVYVIEDEVIAVINRIPANILGDGIHTVKELIGIKNEKRKKNPRLYTCLIKIDFEVKNMLRELGISLDDIPKKDQRIFLREKSNISTGGDSVELTDDFPDEIKQIAIDALKSIKDFPHGGVDIIFDEEKPLEKSAVVLELSPTPQIGSLVFPMEGKSRDVPAAIIDYYFPETKKKHRQYPPLYFNLNSILKPLVNKSADEVKVTSAPKGKIEFKKFIVSGKVQGVGYRRWVRKKALEADLYGFAKNIKNGDVEVVIAGEIGVINNFKKVCFTGPKSASVQQIKESSWDQPINVGFELKKQPSEENVTDVIKVKEGKYRNKLHERVIRKVSSFFKK